MDVLANLLAPQPAAPLPCEAMDIGHTAAAVTLAQEVADLMGTTLDLTWWSLCNVPADMLAMLDSPQGWSALAGYIACDLGEPTLDYCPRVH